MKTQESWAKTRISELKLIIEAAVDSDTLGKVSAIFILTLTKKDLSVLIKPVKR